MTKNKYAVTTGILIGAVAATAAVAGGIHYIIKKRSALNEKTVVDENEFGTIAVSKGVADKVKAAGQEIKDAVVEEPVVKKTAEKMKDLREKVKAKAEVAKNEVKAKAQIKKTEEEVRKTV